MIYISKNEEDTAALAARLAGALRAGDVLFLRGALGAGKSVFARALIRTLAGDRTLDVPSPTFTLLQAYDTPAGGALWHFDLYRLKSPEEVYELGWEEAPGDTIILIEWPEQLGALAPPDRAEITFAPLAGAPNHREITLLLHGKMKDRHEFAFSA